MKQSTQIEQIEQISSGKYFENTHQCIAMLHFRKLRREERVLRGKSIEEEKEEEEEEEKEEKGSR